MRNRSYKSILNYCRSKQPKDLFRKNLLLAFAAVSFWVMIYLITDIEKKYCKIGFSDNIKKRFSGIKSSCPIRLILMYSISGDLDLEKEIHHLFRNLRVRGEWFKFKEGVANYFRSKNPKVYFVEQRNEPVPKFIPKAKEKDYTHIYSQLSDISVKLKSVSSFKFAIWVLSSDFDKSNGISSGKHVFQKFNKHLEVNQMEKIGERTFQACFEELTKIGVFTKVGRGHYYVNPYMFWRDSLKKRTEFLIDEKKEALYKSLNPAEEEKITEAEVVETKLLPEKKKPIKKLK